MSSDAEIGLEVVENFASNESLEAAKDVLLGEPFGEPALHVVDSPWVSFRLFYL